MTLEILQALPQSAAADLVALSERHAASDPRFLEGAEAILMEVDWSTRRLLLSSVIGQMFPLEQLVPDAFKEWRPVVQDAFAFFAASLSPSRLVPKLLQQLQLSPDTQIEKRIALFVERTPSLHKIGQILARNRHLDRRLKQQLTRFENHIRDVEFEAIAQTIRAFAGPGFQELEVQLEERVLAEASVAAVVAFSWRRPGQERRSRGVFKVLKPYVREYIAEETRIIGDFLDQLQQRPDYSSLRKLRVRELLLDASELIAQEIQLVNEQRHLTLAAQRYAATAEIQVPVLIPELSRPDMTAMSYLPGRKISDCVRFAPLQCRKLMQRLVEWILLRPLFDANEIAIFHGDPHPGNILFDPSTGQLQLLDWALVEALSRVHRRHLILLLCGVMLRDEEMLLDALRAFCKDDLDQDSEQLHTLRGTVRVLFFSRTRRYSSSITSMNEASLSQNGWIVAALADQDGREFGGAHGWEFARQALGAVPEGLVVGRCACVLGPGEVAVRRDRLRGGGVGEAVQRVAERGLGQGGAQLLAAEAAQFEQQEGVVVELAGEAIVDAGDVLAGVGVVGAGAVGEFEVLAIAGQQ
jgi:hypothetical protein